MSSSLQFFLLLSIIIAGAKLGGWISSRLRQPAVLGELLVGLFLGPTFLNLMHRSFVTDPHIESSVFLLAELGVLFLMFVAGLQVDVDEFLSAGKAAFWTGLSGVIAPLIFGSLVALGFGFPPVESLFIGVILTATSVSISAQTLMELGKLRTKEGITLLEAAVIDDVMGVIVLSFFVAFFGKGDAWVIVFAIRRQRRAGRHLLGHHQDADLPRACHCGWSVGRPPDSLADRQAADQRRRAGGGRGSHPDVCFPG